MSSTPLVGYRLSVIAWKTPSKEKDNASYKRKPTICVAVPSLNLSVTPSCLAVAMREALEGMQDAAIREIVVNALERDTSIAISSIWVPEELGTPEGLAAWNAKQSVSARLSTASLTTWFDNVVAGPLVELVVSKLPPETMDLEGVAIAQVEKAKIAIVSLASPRVTMPKKIAEQLAKALGAVVAEGDSTRAQLEKRLDFFINPPVSAELLLNL